MWVKRVSGNGLHVGSNPCVRPHFMIIMEKPKESKQVTVRATIRINGITEEEVFDALIDTFRNKWGKDFKMSVSGRDKDLEEKHIL